MLVKAKRAALCSHAIFASDTHVLCIYCKLSDKQKICDLSNRCVECGSMSTIAFALNSIVVKDFRKVRPSVLRHFLRDTEVKRYMAVRMRPRVLNCPEIL